MNCPTWEEIFNKPWETPIVQCPLAWQGDSVAVEMADREIARLLVSCYLSDPPTAKETRRRGHDNNRY